MNPQPVNEWSEVLNVNESAATCVKVTASGHSGSEDCLYLDVHTPELDFKNSNKKRPVVVWIQGGGFFSDYSLKDLYSPQHFIAKDVVIVKVNFRNGIFGFLRLASTSATGNIGLKDQVLALQWVRNNIALFGGDPNQVTLIGEAAGAISVSLHLISLMSAGLFQKVVIQGASALATSAWILPEKAVEKGFHVVKLLGKEVQDAGEALKVLKAAAVEDLIKAVNNINEQQLSLLLSFLPTIDGEFLDDCPIAKYQAGKFHKVPVLLGINEHAATAFRAVTGKLRQELPKAIDLISQVSSLSMFVSLSTQVGPITIKSDTEITSLASLYYLTVPLDLTQKLLTKLSSEPVFSYKLSEEKINKVYQSVLPNLNANSAKDKLNRFLNHTSNVSSDKNSELSLFVGKMVSLWSNFAGVDFRARASASLEVNGKVWKPVGLLGLHVWVDGAVKVASSLIKIGEDVFAKFYYQALPLLGGCKGAPLIPPRIFI